MSTKIHNLAFISPSSSNPWHSQKAGASRIRNKSVASLDFLFCDWSKSRKKWVVRHALTERSSYALSDFHLVGFKRHRSGLYKSGRRGHFFLFSTAEDGVTLNGSPQSTTQSDTEEMRVKLIQSLQGNDSNDGLVQSLHDAARVFELAIKEQSAFAKGSWFSTAWLGVDRNAWVKSLSYQASVYSLLQAVSEISSRGDGRDRDINVFVQRSVARLSASLESVMRDQLSGKQPEGFEWLWSEKIPLVVTTFVEYFEKDTRFTAATSMSRKGFSLGSGITSDISLLMLALTCIAAIMKLGPAKVSCSQFFSVPDTTGRLMDMLVDFVPMRQAYHSLKEIGLRREFLVHFGPRAATCGFQNDRATEEVIFWVDLVQRQLQRAIDRERIWARLTTSESIEVLERDLAIFGFFIVLGRSTENFLLSNGFNVLDDPLEGFIRYLIGGSVLYYPQLSSISSYQLYVEVVCEELDWLPFFPGHSSMPKISHGHKVKLEGPPNAEAIPQALNVCSYWMQSFIKYSKWLEAPVHAKAARFLSRGHNKLMECMEARGVIKNCIMESRNKSSSEKTGPETCLTAEKEPDSFDKALESVDEALIRLEELLQEMHVAGSNPGREHLKAACSDLERIRKLKKEAEFLEASFRAKANSLQQGDENNNSHSAYNDQQKHRAKNKRSSNTIVERSRSKSRGMWTIGLPRSIRTNDPGSSIANDRDEKPLGQTSVNSCAAESESNESSRFEHLKKELIELEMRVQRSSDRSAVEGDVKARDDDDGSYINEAEGVQLVQVQESENIIAKSFHKLKETGTDVWQGTQLLAIDTGAATELLRRALVGDELTEKEKKVLRRTITDLASVIPIGILMLLPVTAVGHAAMLAAIQRYVPSLIPSTYGPERLNLLRQLEKVKEIDAVEVSPDENAEESA